VFDVPMVPNGTPARRLHQPGRQLGSARRLLSLRWNHRDKDRLVTAAHSPASLPECRIKGIIVPI